MLYHKYKPLASRVYCTGAGAAVGAVRGVQLQRTGYAAGFQPHHAAGADRVRRAASGRENYPADRVRGPLAEGAYRRCAGLHGVFVVVWRRFVVFLAALIGLGAKDVDWETALRVYLVTAVAGLVLVQLLHFATPLMPYKFYCRNWDFGYGHYNGFGARLVGVFFAWAWLRHDRLHAFDWAGLAALAIFTYKVPGSRGGVRRHGGAVCAVLCAAFAAETVRQQIFYGLALALPVALAVFSLYAGYVYNPDVAL